MRFFLISCAFLVGCASAYVKSGVKGGYGGQQHEYHGGENLIKLFGNNTQHGYNTQNNEFNNNINYEKGVCYQEVPTATLVRDPAHVPAGNGSRPDLSRIRTCCHGYIKNIHNYKICEPVCTKECINALCTAPETCTCFPDHVKNAAGICVATCPIGCQNGHCAGGECLCKEGFRLDIDGKFCIPICRGNCGGIGNCTSPNTCECRTGYQSTPDGSCLPAGSGCDRCTNGDCISNECRCHHGYLKDQQGRCVPQCNMSCGPGGSCIQPNVCYVPNSPRPPSNYTSPPINQSFNNSYPYNQEPNQRPNQSLNQGSNQFSNPNNLDSNVHTYPHGYRPYYPQQGSTNSTYSNQYPSHNDNPSYPNRYPGYNPNPSYPNSQHPSYPNQDSSNYPLYPGQGTNHPLNPNQNSNSPNQGSQYPYPNNQGPRQPINVTSPNPDATYIVNTTNQPGYPTSLNQIVNSSYSHNQSNYSSTSNQDPSYPSYPSNHGYNPSYPSSQGPNPSYPSSQGHNPSYPSNQGSNPLYHGYNPSYPSSQGHNPSYPSNQGQNPSYPSSQGRNPSYPSNQGSNPSYPSSPNPSYLPNQDSNPSYPSNQGSNPSNQGSNPYYPSNQGSNPSYPSSPNYPNNQGSYPYTTQIPNNQYPYSSNYDCGQQPCINGVCYGGRCSCYSGYELDRTDTTGHTCQPIRPTGCVMECISPDVCICKMGYHRPPGVKA